jgi:hypothetical protein
MPCSQLIMMSACQLHEAGVRHWNLLDRRHFVAMGNGIRIVDFSAASSHKCSKSTAFFWGCEPRLVGCSELQRLAISCGRGNGPHY